MVAMRFLLRQTLIKDIGILFVDIVHLRFYVMALRDDADRAAWA
jgi:hypothetical protein